MPAPVSYTHLVESIKAVRASLPENVRNAEGMKGLACDLIKFDKRYGDIFTYLLGRVAVVGTMDDAVSLSKKTGSGVRSVSYTHLDVYKRQIWSRSPGWQFPVTLQKQRSLKCSII